MNFQQQNKFSVTLSLNTNLFLEKCFFYSIFFKQSIKSCCTSARHSQKILKRPLTSCFVCTVNCFQSRKYSQTLFRPTSKYIYDFYCNRKGNHRLKFDKIKNKSVHNHVFGGYCIYLFFSFSMFLVIITLNN